MQQLAPSPAETLPVKLIDQFPIYEIGGALRLLNAVCGRESADSFDQLFALWTAGKHLNQLLAGDPLPLKYCRQSAVELSEEINAHQEHFRQAPESDSPAPPIERWKLRALKKKVEIFEHQFSAELKKTAVYAVPERGIFNTEGLAENAEHHIHESIRKEVSKFALSEYRAAGRCLAFGLYSASGFHSARAVEDVLKAYYESFLGQPNDIPMGLMASHLNDQLTAKDVRIRPKENTVRHLRDITSFDRNPLIHKNVELEEIDATTLFNSALGVIVEMVKEMRDNKDASKQEALPFNAEGESLGMLLAPKVPPRTKRGKAELGSV